MKQPNNWEFFFPASPSVCLGDQCNGREGVRSICAPEKEENGKRKFSAASVFRLCNLLIILFQAGTRQPAKCFEKQK
jgi:hypothetical protein